MTETDINTLTAAETAGQLVMPRIDFDNEKYLEQAVRFVEEFKVAGFIVFNGEIDQVRETVLTLQKKSKYPLLFGIDAERGLGQIIKGGTRFPFLMSQGASNSMDLVELQAINTAQEMKYCGLNLLFAPVLDINTNPENPIVNVRSFSDNADVVSRLGSLFYNKIKAEGIFACGKHFPGHGSTDVDSHVDLPVIEKSIKELSELELIPFKKAVEQGIDFIMAGHLAFGGHGGEIEPAVYSKRLIEGLLRNELGFKNIVITDSFRMDALRELGEEHEIAINSIRAGCDIILDPNESEILIEQLTLKITNDKNFYSLALNSLKRLFEIKKNIQPASDNYPDRKEARELVNSIAEKSVCLVKGPVFETGEADINIFDVTRSGENVCEKFLEQLAGNGIEIMSVNYVSDNYDYSTVYNHSVINIVITNVSAWTKNSELTDYFSNVLSHISDKDCNKILVAFGSPYVIAQFLDYNTVICSFEIIEPCQVAVADILTGQKSSSAKLPVKF